MPLLKLAAYLDEAHDEPFEAIKIIKQAGIHHIAIRNVWNTPIHLIKDDLIASLKKEMIQHDVSPVILCSNIGNIDSSKLANISDNEIDRLMQVASYLKLNIIKLGIGVQEPYNNSVGIQDDNVQLDQWLKRVHNLAITYGVTLLYEARKVGPSFDISVRYPKWKILFDPANYISNSPVDVYDKYYIKFKQYLGAVELHDYLTGIGHKPIGFGKAKIKEIINDCENSNFNGWYILEHSLGRKYASYKSRHEVFIMAKQALDTVLEI